MKTTIFILVLATLSVACNKEKVISRDDLPANAIAFLETHFHGVATVAVIKETEKFDHEYTVHLANGFTVDFNSSGEWDKVDGHTSPVPESVLGLLPEDIPGYVASAFPGIGITEVNKERYGYEISLSNKMELRFDSTGKLTGFDD